FTLNAGIRWGGRGAWAVSLYSLIVYGWLLLVETPTELNLNNDLMRLGYFLIVGALGGYLAEYRRRRENELRMLQISSEAIGGKTNCVGALAALVARAESAALADVAVGVLREPGDGDVFMARGASEVGRLTEEEAA